jgi:hypothetical protein
MPDSATRSGIQSAYKNRINQIAQVLMKKLFFLLSLTVTQYFSFCQTFSWAATFGTPANPPTTVVMAVDDAENTYVLAVDNGSYGSKLARYSSAGVLLWKQYISKLANVKMAVDHNNNVLVAGTDGPDYTLIRYSSGGAEFKKMKLLPYVTGGGNTIEAIAVDANNSYILTGGFNADFTFGTCGITSDGNKRLYVAKFDASDNCKWLIGSDKGGIAMNHRLAVDNFGNSYLSGLYGNSIVIQGKSIVAPSSMSPFVARIKTDGQVDWVKNLPGVSPDVTTCDRNQNFVFAGQYGAYVQLGPASLTIASNDVANGYFAKMDPQGNIVDARQFGSPYFDEVFGVSCPANNVYVCGTYRYQTSFDDITISSSSTNGHTEPFIAQFSPSGKWEWATNTGCVDPGFGLAVGVGNISDNAVYFVGQINGTMTFGGRDQTGAGDVFVAKLANNFVGFDKNIATDAKFAIFPNPAVSAINISALVSDPGTVNIYVYEYRGRKVLAKEVRHPGGLFLDKEDVSSLPNGTYVIELWQNETRQASRQFIK